ncbi:hypothetical protein ACFW96_09175 [Streptomyces gardneri]|uniref:hypothetical protein n=1 Tax=Streptomyces gardneri TaxID=66892 RepID=UPI0036AAD862
MSDEEKPVEEPESSSRAAGGCVLLVALGAAGGAVHAVPELGYTVAGILATVAARKARTWAANRRQPDDSPDEAQDVVDIIAALHVLSPAGAVHVRLTELQEATGLPDTKAVRALLDEDNITIRTGVRAGGKNGPGVHSDDIPRWSCGPSSEGCWCTSDANTNANNADGEGPEEGLRVVRTDTGATYYTTADTHHPVAH